MATSEIPRRRSAAHSAPQEGSSTSASGNGHKEPAPLDSILITGELANRPARNPQYDDVHRACLALAHSIAESPETIFEELAQTALRLCNAHSAGFSLLEEKGARYCWRSIAGRWAECVGRGTPADFGPCAVVVERDAAQLFLHPERRFTYLAPLTPSIEEALLVPFHARGSATGIMWVMTHDQSKHFDSEDLRVMEDLASFASAAHQLVRSTQSADLHDVRRLQEISGELLLAGQASALYEKILQTASAIMHSDFASIQILDPRRGQLHLLGYKGFHPDSAKFWEWVEPKAGCVCAVALRTGKRVITPDVETCGFMAGTDDLKFYRRSKIRAVQSTPLLSRSGELLGMISTHWSRPYSPAERDLRLLDILARQAADVLERVQTEQALKNSNERLEERVQARTRELEMQVHETRRTEESLRAVTARLFKVQDHERRHIARELHAGASQTLAALSMSFGRLTKMATTIEELEIIHESHALIERVTREIRTISYLLHPPLLEELGLAFALRAYAEGFSERSGIPVRVENDALLERLPDDSEIAVFRVVQESLSNIHRHSGATKVRIRVAECAGGLQLTISDNGKGVSEEKQRELAESVRAGVGILGMRERIRQLGGTLEIVSGVPSPGAAPDFAEAFSFYGKGASVREERRARTTGAECKAQPANAKPVVTQRSAAAKTSGHRTAALVARATKSAGAARNEFATRNRARHTIKSVGPGTCVSVTVPLPRAAHA